MKKVIVGCIATLFMSSGAFATVTHFTETLPAAQAQGNVPVANGYDWGMSQNSGVVISSAIVGMQSFTLTQINASTAAFVGELLYCNNCAAAGGAGTICVSTSTNAPGAGSDFVLSTGTQCK